MKVERRMILVKSLRVAAYNPDNRVSVENTKDLQASMEAFGMFSPIIVSSKMSVIDGHRRLSVAKRLGWKEIECNVTDADAEDVYASVNRTSRKLSGNDAIGVWLTEPRAVPKGMDKSIRKVVTTIGKPLLTKLYKSGCSLRVYHVAVRIARSVDQRDPKTVSSIVSWLLDFATIGQVAKALEAGVDPRKIMKAVKSKKAIVLKLDVA